MSLIEYNNYYLFITSLYQLRLHSLSLYQCTGIWLCFTSPPHNRHLAYAPWVCWSGTAIDIPQRVVDEGRAQKWQQEQNITLWSATDQHLHVTRVGRWKTGRRWLVSWLPYSTAKGSRAQGGIDLFYFNIWWSFLNELELISDNNLLRIDMFVSLHYDFLG